MTQDEAVKAIDLMVTSLNHQPQKFPIKDLYLLVSLEIACHVTNAVSEISGLNKLERPQSGNVFYWKGVKCRIA